MLPLNRIVPGRSPPQGITRRTFFWLSSTIDTNTNPRMDAVFTSSTLRFNGL